MLLKPHWNKAVDVTMFDVDIKENKLYLTMNQGKCNKSQNIMGAVPLDRKPSAIKVLQCNTGKTLNPCKTVAKTSQCEQCMDCKWH